MKNTFQLMKQYLKPQLNKIILLGFLLILTVAISLINPQIIGYFIDQATNHASASSLVRIAVIFILLAFTQQIILILSTYLSQTIGWNATNALREDLISHAMHLDMSFHKEQKSGELVERVDGDVTALFNFFSNLLLKFINNIALLLGIIILLSIRDIRIGLGILGFTIIAMVVLAKFQKIAVPKWVKERKKSAKFYGYIGENISSNEDIRALGAISYVMYRFYQFIKDWERIRHKAFIMYGYIWSITLIIFAFGYVISFGLGSYLYHAGAISLGTVYIIIHYTDLLERPIEQIRVQLQDLQKAMASVKRVQEFFSFQSKLIDGHHELLGTGPLALQFKDVDFYYEENQKVLNNLSFTLEKGKILGLLGRTGSGKTTISRLIVRLYDVKSGEIFLNSQKVNEIKLNELRNDIAYVTQDVELFNGTIRDNLTFYNKQIADETIMNAIDNLKLHPWFKLLPNGLDTKLQPGASSLSAGEAQLLALIRVFLKNPRFIILDEASSRLDPITERLIEEAMNQLLKDKTCIIIAHRLKTIRRAHDLLILENGNIIEYGNREQLIKNSDSKFNELLKHGIEEVLA